ncbi:hypothetical protein IQA79_17145 [Leptospira borgpetersenii serovar Ballum]|nr:hypothetical protein [Leptospira borgpetersenii serovar Ballum]
MKNRIAMFSFIQKSYGELAVFSFKTTSYSLKKSYNPSEKVIPSEERKKRRKKKKKKKKKIKKRRRRKKRAYMVKWERRCEKETDAKGRKNLI